MALRLAFFLLTCFCIGSCEDENISQNTFEGCCQTIGIDAAVGTGNVYVPNIFTPNDDGINDKYQPFASEEIDSILTFEISTANDVLFLAENFAPFSTEGRWDGVENGTFIKGVFNVKVIAKSINGTVETLFGEVCSLPCLDEAEADVTIDFSGCQHGTQHNGEGGIDWSLPSFEAGLPCIN